MLRVSAFRGVRFDPRLARLGDSICPPYDVIPEGLARKLRRRPVNAIHVELPFGSVRTRYRNAAKQWRTWMKNGALLQDAAPSFYLLEQKFTHEGRSFTRLGLLAALGLDRDSAARVMAHERTLSKPRQDRTRLLKALKVNTSPIFGLFKDGSGKIRRILSAVRRRRPDARGRAPGGASCRFWIIHEAGLTEALSRAFRQERILIADGHHRFRVALEQARKAKQEDGAVLAYLCPENDPGLVVLPTHRVIEKSARVFARIKRLCDLKLLTSTTELANKLASSRSPYSFALYDGRLHLAEPKPGDKGVPSGFATDWLAQRVLSGMDPHDIRYFHDTPAALKAARRSKSLALILKRFPPGAIRKAVETAGLLPQKSTYFIPKVPTGLVFRPL